MSLPLSRAFPSREGVPVIDQVDPRIFTLTYFAHCMDCSFCHDTCCRYGADIELARIRAVEQYRDELERYLGVPRAEWYRDRRGDVGMVPEPEYPGGAYTRTSVVDLPPGRSPHNEIGCVFLDPHGRGCRLHRFALERGIEVQSIKPMVCTLFPLSFDNRELFPACEFDQNDLICQGAGLTLYRAAREEVRYYFGSDMVADLDRLERETPPAAAPRYIPLPVSS